MAEKPKLTQEQLYKIRMERPHERRDNIFGIQLQRRSDYSEAQDKVINKDLAYARKKLRDAIAGDGIILDGQTIDDTVDRAKYRLASVEEKRADLIDGREDTTSTHKRSGLDRRSRARRYTDPDLSSKNFFSRMSVPEDVTVIGGQRVNDPEWLFDFNGKKPMMVPKGKILNDRFVTQGILKNISRTAGPLMMAGGAMDLLSGGDPLDSEIAGDPEPGGELDQFAGERRGESMANLAILKQRLAEALAREGK